MMMPKHGELSARGWLVATPSKHDDRYGVWPEKSKLALTGPGDLAEWKKSNDGWLGLGTFGHTRAPVIQ